MTERREGLCSTGCYHVLGRALRFSLSMILPIVVLMLVASSAAVASYRVEASSAINVSQEVGETPPHSIGVDPMNGNPPVTVSPALSVGGGGGVLAKTGDSTGLATLWRHLMCRDFDANYQPIGATTTFAPTDQKATSLLTAHISVKFHTVWHYRHDSAKAWNYYNTIEWYPGSEGDYYLWSYISIAGYTPSTFYPWGWKVDIFLDNNYQATDYFEITDDGKKSAMCEGVDSNGNCINEKSEFKIGTETGAYHYLRLDHIAYFNEATGHVHDFKCEWYAPDGSVYRTYQNWWPDYKDSDPNYDYWGWGYDPYDYISIGSNTPTGTWTVKTYLDQYYNSGWLWYGPISTISFTVSSQPNHPPTLSSGTVDPSRGSPSTQFTFLVKYTDSDNDPAATRRLYVYDSGWGYVDMDHFSGNPSSGEWFYKRLTGFSVGDHQFFFFFTDGKGGEDYDPESGYYSFTVTQDQPPSLSNGYVDPSSGTTSTTFSYYVTYSDPEGAAPTVRRVWIDGGSHDMSLYSGTASSGTYRYQTVLSIGGHNYYFEFSDGANSVRLPPSGSYSGPTVNPETVTVTVTSTLTSTSYSTTTGTVTSTTYSPTLTSYVTIRSGTVTSTRTFTSTVTVHGSVVTGGTAVSSSSLIYLLLPCGLVWLSLRSVPPLRRARKCLRRRTP